MSVRHSFLYHSVALSQEVIGTFQHARRAGLYAAPGAGLSTFLRADVIPDAQAEGWEPVYVAEKVIGQTSLTESLSRAVLTSLKWEGLSLGQDDPIGMKIDAWSEAEALDEISKLECDLVLMFQTLSSITGRPLFLVIDECGAAEQIAMAQGVLETLHHQLGVMMLVASHRRDGLSWLRSFLGHEGEDLKILTFQHEPADFAQALNRHLDTFLAEGNRFRTEDLARAFSSVGFRPARLWECVRFVSLELGLAASLGELIDGGGDILPFHAWNSTFEESAQLTRLQRIVLMAADEHIDQHGGFYRPFSQVSRADITRRMRVHRLATSSIQKAVKSLRSRGYLWRTHEGGYGVEDTLVILYLRDERLRRNRNNLTVIASPGTPATVDGVTQ